MILKRQQLLQMFKNLHLLPTHLAVAIAVFVMCHFQAFCLYRGKKEWPAGTRGKYHVDTVTLLPNKPSCAQSFCHPLRRVPHKKKGFYSQISYSESIFLITYGAYGI